jgi:5-methylcytosine-specific restriction protein B
MIQQKFEVILRRYVQARLEPFGGTHELFSVFEELQDEFFRLEALRTRPHLKVKFGVGKGNWARVPWIAFLDKSVTIQNGVYCVYLFRQDMSGVYITFNQGVTELINQNGRPRAHKELRKRAEAIKQYCSSVSSNGFLLGNGIDLRADPGLGADYEHSTIAYKLYETSQVPDDSSIVADLESVLKAYDDYLQGRPPIDLEPPPIPLPPQPQVDDQDIARTFYQNAADAKVGLQIKDMLATNVVSSLLTKRFLLLTGLSGSGKTKIAHAFASWISELPEQFRLVAVGADWTSNENVLGYQDALQPAIYRKPPSGALDLILQAEKDPERPYFLILDEMNLSHVERYFADILSAIESGQEIALHSATEPLGAFENDPLPVPARVRLPENLFIIGTVNIDETTYMFSPKVLDRANVIEFRVTGDEISSFLESPAKVNMDALAGKGAGYGRAFVNAARAEVSLAQLPPEIADGAAVAVDLKQRLTDLFVELAPIGAEFGFRTAFEVSRFFYHHALLTGAGWQFKDALDAQIVQKLMPKLHGSDRKLRKVLDKLKTFCETHDLKLSLAKTERMLERLTQDGFTSFAEA